MDASTSDSSLVVDGENYILQSCCPHSATSPAPGVTRFTVRYDDPKVKGSLRSELRFKSTGYETPTTYSAKIRPQSPWPSRDEFVIAMQWHAQKDMWLGEPGRFPPLEFSIEDGEWVIIKSYDTNLITLPNDKEVERVTLARLPFEPGEWVDWKITASWSTGETGRLDIWKDGNKVVSDSGPNAYWDAVGPYWKLGTYRPQQAKRITRAEPVSIDFSDIRLAVSPGGTEQ